MPWESLRVRRYARLLGTDLPHVKSTLATRGLELRLAPTIQSKKKRFSAWSYGRRGDEYSMEIVHTDPYGGAYGGHFMIYGNGDDNTWGQMILVGPHEPIGRLAE